MVVSLDRSRAIALAATLTLHVAALLWLLALRFERPAAVILDERPVWFPALPALPSLPPEPDVRLEPDLAPVMLPAPRPPVIPEPVVPRSRDALGWLNDARDAAAEVGKESPYRRFGEFPKAPTGRPKDEYPPSIWKKVSKGRAGTSERTAEGEQIYWVTDDCFISLGTQSLTMLDFHKAREGMLRCSIPLGRKKPRSDLFEHLKRKPVDPFPEKKP